MVFKKGHKTWLGKTHSEETRRKIGKAHKSKKRSKETRRKMSETRKGRKLMLGKNIQKKLGER
ncbi:MAG: hypothetical protein EX285_04585 [Thaumarchaeota archaeon]|nr:hypothetical protein [Nitrososphaerota archaeon]